ncbi:MAG: chemotaxis response regulator protein-glutamate methylesterase [Planctomycetota bacterium]
MNKPIRIMLCDDSALMRRLIKTAIETDPKCKVTWEAKNGRDALEQLKSSQPDVLVLDVEMPVMDGIDATRAIRREGYDLPIIMFSSLTSRGAEATLDAVAAGANDFATKPSRSGHIEQAIYHVQQELIPRIHRWAMRHAGVAPADDVVPPEKSTTVDSQPVESSTTPPQRISAVAIGVSTGGPQALSAFMNHVSPDIQVPILIVQHMPPVFTALLAERLTAQSGHTVKEASHGQEVGPGVCLVAPGDQHLTVERDLTSLRVRLSRDEPENSCRPAVDPLFRSCAKCFGAECLGVVLTGMGKDGLNGARALKEKGARILCQDESSSVVWGMPGNIARSGLADRVLPIDQIAAEVNRVAGAKLTPIA